MKPTGRATSQPIVLRRREQWEALLSPARVEVVDHFEQAGPSSIREVAAALGRTQHSLYHHIHLLENVGILQLAHSRVSGSREESVYELAGSRVELPDAGDTAVQRELRQRAMRLMLRQAERDATGAIEHGVLGEPRYQTFQVRRHKGRLSVDQLRRLHTHVEAIHEILRESTDSAAGRMFVWTSALAPVEFED